MAKELCTNKSAIIIQPSYCKSSCPNIHLPSFVDNDYICRTLSFLIPIPQLPNSPSRYNQSSLRKFRFCPRCQSKDTQLIEPFFVQIGNRTNSIAKKVELIDEHFDCCICNSGHPHNYFVRCIQVENFQKIQYRQRKSMCLSSSWRTPGNCHLSFEDRLHYWSLRSMKY